MRSRYAGEVLRERTADPWNAGQPEPKVTLRFLGSDDMDRRRYNCPTTTEVAALFLGEDRGPPDSRDFVLYPREFEGWSEGFA